MPRVFADQPDQWLFICRRGESEFCIDNLLVSIYFIVLIIRWTGLAPWEFEFPFSGSLTSTFLVPHGTCRGRRRVNSHTPAFLRPNPTTQASCSDGTQQALHQKRFI